MTASAIFEIDTGAGYGQPGVAQDAQPGATVTCRLASVLGVRTIEWEIALPGSIAGTTHARLLPSDPPIAVPTLTYGGVPNGQTVTFDVDSYLGQAYGIRCRVNRGLTTDNIAKSAVYVLDDAGRRPFFVGEELEHDQIYGITARLGALTGELLTGTAAAGVTTTIKSYPMAEDSVLSLRGRLTASDTGGDAAYYEFAGLWRRIGAAAPVLVALVESVSIEDDLLWDVGGDVDGNSARVRFVPDAANATTYSARLEPLEHRP
jgi:hypothetical protein